MAAAESKQPVQRVLFIDADNHSASRFCEELFNHRATTLRAATVAYSRACIPAPAWRTVGPMCSAAIQGLQRRGVHASDHLRLPLEYSTLDLLLADLVVLLDAHDKGSTLERQLTTTHREVRHWEVARGERPAGTRLTRLDRLVGELIAELTAVPKCERRHASSAQTSITAHSVSP